MSLYFQRQTAKRTAFKNTVSRRKRYSNKIRRTNTGKHRTRRSKETPRNPNNNEIYNPISWPEVRFGAFLALRRVKNSKSHCPPHFKDT